MTKLNTTKRNARNTTTTKRATTKRNTTKLATKLASKHNASVASKRNATTKQAAASDTKFSAARVLLACGITNAKSGRALLRAHAVERNEKAIRAFFAARAKQRS